MLLFVVLKLILIIKLRPSKVAPDGVDDKEQEGKDKEPKHNINGNFPTYIEVENYLQP